MSFVVSGNMMTPSDFRRHNRLPKSLDQFPNHHHDLSKPSDFKSTSFSASNSQMKRNRSSASSVLLRICLVCLACAALQFIWPSILLDTQMHLSLDRNENKLVGHLSILKNQVVHADHQLTVKYEGGFCVAQNLIIAKSVAYLPGEEFTGKAELIEWLQRAGLSVTKSPAVKPEAYHLTPVHLTVLQDPASSLKSNIDYPSASFVNQLLASFAVRYSQDDHDQMEWVVAHQNGNSSAMPQWIDRWFQQKQASSANLFFQSSRKYKTLYIGVQSTFVGQLERETVDFWPLDGHAYDTVFMTSKYLRDGIRPKRQSKKPVKSSIGFATRYQISQQKLLELLRSQNSKDTWEIQSVTASCPDVIVGDSSSDAWLFSLMTCPRDVSLIDVHAPTSLSWNLARILGQRLTRLYITKNGPDKSDHPQTSHPFDDYRALAQLVGVSDNFPAHNFLMYMPWEQLNNQLIEFKSACAMANILNRVLVIPYLGQRKPDLLKKAEQEWRFSFKISEFDWQPFEWYFNEVLMTDELPCRTVTTLNFRSLFYNYHSIVKEPEATDKRSVGTLYFNPFAHATVESQLHDYYYTVLKLPYTRIQTTPKQHQISKEEIIRYFSKSRPEESRNQQDTLSPIDVIPLGCAFWLYNFEKWQPYPLQSYINYMDHSVYRRISAALFSSIRGRSTVTVNTLVMQSVNALKSFLPNSRNFEGALHLRRGDYSKKCESIKDSDLRAKCYPPIESIDRHLRKFVPAKKPSQKPWIYIATNANPSSPDIIAIEKSYNVIHIRNLPQHIMNVAGQNKQETSQLLEELRSLNPLEEALFDMYLCSTRSDFFLGNMYSSFSRTVFEWRELQNRPSDAFQ